MASLNTFRSKNVLKKSQNKLHGLIVCAIIVFYVIFEWLPHLCTPHIQIIVRSLSRAVNFQQIQPQRTGRFSNATQRSPIGRWVKKEDIEYPFEHGKVINYTFDGVSIQPFTTKIQVSLINPLWDRRVVSRAPRQHPVKLQSTKYKLNY